MSATECAPRRAPALSPHRRGTSSCRTNSRCVAPAPDPAPRRPPAPPRWCAAPRRRYAAPRRRYAAPRRRYAAPRRRYAAPRRPRAAPLRRYVAPVSTSSALRLARDQARRPKRTKRRPEPIGTSGPTVGPRLASMSRCGLWRLEPGARCGGVGGIGKTREQRAQDALCIVGTTEFAERFGFAPHGFGDEVAIGAVSKVVLKVLEAGAGGSARKLNHAERNVGGSRFRRRRVAALK